MSLPKTTRQGMSRAFNVFEPQFPHTEMEVVTVPAQRATGRIVGDVTPGPMADVKYSNSSTI